MDFKFGIVLATANCFDSFNNDGDPCLISDFSFYHISQAAKTRKSYK